MNTEIRAGGFENELADSLPRDPLRTALQPPRTHDSENYFCLNIP